MSYIYLISNDINEKQYIGYTSQQLNKRFYRHVYEAEHKENDSSVLHKAIKKYGQEHFSISALEEFNEEEKNWQKLEQSYIKFYNTQVPNGYNVTPGGERPPIHYGEDNYKTKLSEQDLLKLKDELVEGTEFISDLAIKYHLSSSQVERINAGEFRIHQDWDYPLRKLTPWETKQKKVTELLKENKYTRQEIAEKAKCSLQYVSIVNQGRINTKFYDGTFPIQKLR